MLGPWWQVSIVAIVSSIIFLVLDPSFPGSTPFWFMLLITWFSWLNRWIYISVLDCHLLPLAFPLVTTSSISTPSIMQGVRLSPSHTHKIKKNTFHPVIGVRAERCGGGGPSDWVHCHLCPVAAITAIYPLSSPPTTPLLLLSTRVEEA